MHPRVLTKAKGRKTGRQFDALFVAKGRDGRRTLTENKPPTDSRQSRYWSVGGEVVDDPNEGDREQNDVLQRREERRAKRISQEVRSIEKTVCSRATLTAKGKDSIRRDAFLFMKRAMLS